MSSAHPKLDSLPQTLRHFASQAPGREAARDRHQSLSYAELDAAVDSFAQQLRRLGLAPGERLAFLGPPGLPYWICLLGTMRAGAVWMGLNPSYKERELAHVLLDARPRLCLASAEVPAAARAALRGALAAAGTSIELDCGTSVDEMQRALSDAPALGPAENADARALALSDVCLLVYTSGSTGTPKGALLTGRGLVENGWWMARRMDFEPVRALVNLPVNHVGCVGDLCATVLVAGGTAVFMDRFDARRAVQLLVEQRITWLAQVPAQFQLMLSSGGLAREQLASVRWLHWGGAAMPEPLIRQFKDWVPDLFNGYGQTECSGTMTLTPRGTSVDALATSVGRAVDPARLRIADEQDAPLPSGGDGEVQLRGPHLFHGYLNNPGATRAAFTADGWLKTGDLGRLDPEGNLLLLGRTREMYKSGGYNVFPREVEEVVEALDGVELCAVVALADPLWGEIGVAFVQSAAESLTVERLQRHCGEQLARYKVPKRFVVCTALPLLPIGKVDKQQLRVQAMALAEHPNP